MYHKTPRMLREEERLGRPLEEIIPETWEKRHGNIERTAEELGIKTNTLYNWMIRLHLNKKTTLVRS